MAESRAGFLAAAEIIAAMRLEIQENRLRMLTLQESYVRLEQLVAGHHEDLYEGNGKPGVCTRIFLLEEDMAYQKGWSKAVDIYRENVRPLHVQFHQEMEMGKKAPSPAPDTSVSVAMLSTRKDIRIALIAASSAILTLVLNWLLTHFHLIPTVPPK